jgi:hypothetical protein
VGIFARGFRAETSPDLAARRGIVVQQADPLPRLGSHRGCGDSAGAGSHSHEIESGAHPVTTSIPEVQVNWQLRTCVTPLTVKRHSMQIPIPHSGARASPSTENRDGSPAMITAAATLAPWGTCTGLPLTEMEIQSLLNRFSRSAPGHCNCSAQRAHDSDSTIAYNFVYHMLHGEENLLSAVSDLPLH